MRQMLGALFGCGWTIHDVVDLSFDQMNEVARCVYAHKHQMINSVLEPISEGLSKGGKGGKKRPPAKGANTQEALRKSGVTAAERDHLLLGRLRDMGFNT